LIDHIMFYCEIASQRTQNTTRRIMIKKLKNILRDLLPATLQVPTKYYCNMLTATLEPEMEILPNLVGSSDRVVDVGGNRGIYAYKFWKQGLIVEVFEPNVNCISILSKWALGKNNVHVYPVALSNRAGIADLEIPIDKSGIEHDASGSIEPHQFQDSKRQAVDVRELDSYHFEEVKLIKIDVEGHELSVIEGAQNTIRSMKPILLIEIEQRHNERPINDTFDKILAFGYQGTFLDNGKLVPITKFEVSQDQKPENFGKPKQRYINNFIFLDKDIVISEILHGKK